MGFMPYVQDLAGPNPVISIKDCDGKGADDKQIGNLLRACERRGKVTVVLDSSGGSLLVGLRVWAALKSFPGTVRTVTKRAASAASAIAMGGSRRSITEDGRIALHLPSVLVQEGGEHTSDEVNDLSHELATLTNSLAAVYASTAGGSPADWMSEMRAECSYGPERAVELGLATDIVPRHEYHQIRNSAGGLDSIGELTPELKQEIGIQTSIAAAVVAAKLAQNQREAAKNGRPRWAKAKGGLFSS